MREGFGIWEEPDLESGLKSIGVFVSRASLSNNAVRSELIRPALIDPNRGHLAHRSTSSYSSLLIKVDRTLFVPAQLLRRSLPP
jgi:hypothetical protein